MRAASQDAVRGGRSGGSWPVDRVRGLIRCRGGDDARSEVAIANSRAKAPRVVTGILARLTIEEAILQTLEHGLCLPIAVE